MYSVVRLLIKKSSHKIYYVKGGEANAVLCCNEYQEDASNRELFLVLPAPT